ncbi:hypothetical protein A6V36_34285 [Paraburkholderia ginsengiterrae]|uniref:Uncharacterized protein n=1 Tax=Paraburkholderia ginsengiterrae TaxID=1462993 RepID=A0A1A9NCA6_9BURK|nr:hypothetical protein A6V36_34285 [Paraburkholderia ginsengiterrae]OAJ63662.1 hypothetical protein A6V37_20240 [Paraburkholderia ginsengiterrae]
MTGTPIRSAYRETARERCADEISPEPDDAAGALEQAALDRTPGGVERERSGQLAGKACCEFRARATGCAAGAQAGEGGEIRIAHRSSRQ